MSEKAIKVRERRGQLRRVHHGVYAVGHDAWSVYAHFIAAVLAGGEGAMLGFYPAAALWDLWRWRPQDVDVIVPGARGRTQPGLRIHRAHVHPDDVRRHHGIRVTSPARTCLDLAGELPPKALRRLVRQAQAERRASVRQLADVIGRSTGHRGAKSLADLIATGPAPTRSELEDVVLDLLLRGGFPHPDVNTSLTRLGRKIVPDFRWAAQRLVVEADGAAWHDGKLAREDDAERQSILEATGERVIRVTWDQALQQPERFLDRVRAAWPA